VTPFPPSWPTAPRRDRHTGGNNPYRLRASRSRNAQDQRCAPERVGGASPGDQFEAAEATEAGLFGDAGLFADGGDAGLFADGGEAGLFADGGDAGLFADGGEAGLFADGGDAGLWADGGDAGEFVESGDAGLAAEAS